MTKMKFNFVRRSLACVLFAFISSTACGSGAVRQDFSFQKRVEQFPARMIEITSRPGTRELLERFQPRFFVARDSYRPLNFYRDYLPRCVVRDIHTGDIAFDRVDPKKLRAIARDDRYYLDYLVAPEDARAASNVAAVYARAYRDRVGQRELIFLKYSLVFPYSGLPAELGWWRRAGAALLGDTRAWHELDIHGAVHVVLDARTRRPAALLLAQHNHHRTYLVGREIQWPADQRVIIAFSSYSNEPYPSSVQSTARRERTVGNPLELEYLSGRTDSQPLTAGIDLVPGPAEDAIQIETRLRLLAADDPLYTAFIPLGDRNDLPGFSQIRYRDGPPGMDFYTLPELKNLGDLLAFWYIDPDDDRLFTLLKTDMNSFEDYRIAPALAHQIERLERAFASE